MKWPNPWKLVRELERKLQENQALAKRVAREGVEEKALKKEGGEAACRYRTT